MSSQTAPEQTAPQHAPDASVVDADVTLSPGSTTSTGLVSTAGGADVAGLQRLLSQIVGSSDAAAVFASLADVLVPSLCDSATTTMPTTMPTSTAAGSSVRTAPVVLCAEEPGWFTATVTVDADAGPPARPPSLAGGDEVDDPAGAATQGRYTVLVVCRWQDSPPSAERLLLVELLCRQAAALVLHTRYRAALREQETGIYHLRRALVSNRTIAAAVGILMANRKVTYEQAFGVLLATSQRTNRKIIDLADEVLLTGQLMA